MTIDLDTFKRFCANELDGRDYLREPWLAGEWVYACNGHIAVRLPAIAVPSAQPNDKAPDAPALFKRAIDDAPREYLPLPDFQRRAPCDECGGTGRVRAIKCDDCGGLGEFTRGRHEYECKNCERSPAGAGFLTLYDFDDKQTDELVRVCEPCDGLGLMGGVSRGMFPVQIGGALYSAAYLTMIATLPDVRFSAGDPAREKFDGPREMPAAFVFDGGQGILMPRSA